VKRPIAQTLCDHCGADVGMPHAHHCRTTIYKQRREAKRQREKKQKKLKLEIPR